ncbi:hypothetical protein Q1W73_12055 [Asticcacaulis sp. ZE23SCel15]|uniref:hypothetical protein n=1 Tax=Asticcacaulis sp. ZE23SCel15 TaxID=3059027 RepID=UPI00265E2302|nr:hypothetical protein [Asticcacaulis sp. ZE23SCel15]WKL56421.1 hypothetical protein Q1W73_12055 [Asticcacaulis sp. ZE23SCel15]
MTVTADLKLRESNVVWFDGEAVDSAGNPVRMYSVVTPIEAVEQYYVDGDGPIGLLPGIRLVVLGAANGDVDWLWLEVDDATSAFVNANVCLATAKLKYLCEVGDDLHMKRFSQ